MVNLISWISSLMKCVNNKRLWYVSQIPPFQANAFMASFHSLHIDYINAKWMRRQNNGKQMPTLVQYLFILDTADGQNVLSDPLLYHRIR